MAMVVTVTASLRPSRSIWIKMDLHHVPSTFHALSHDMDHEVQ